MMQMRRIKELTEGDLFAVTPGPAADLGKVLGTGGYAICYEDMYGHIQYMNGDFMVWVDSFTDDL